MTNMHDEMEDYVLVPKRSAKISRARKFVIGLMAVGAVAAMANAGTFASFSASTTNDASFSTARMALQNNGPTGCTSPAALPDVANTGTFNAAVDTNDASGCDALFTDPIVPGEVATSIVTIENVGDVDGDLYLFAEDACNVEIANASFDAGTETDLCDRVLLTIEDGTDCIFPESDADGDGCATLSQSATSDYSFNSFDAYTFGSKLDLGNLATGVTNSYTVNVYMLVSQGGTCSAGTDTTPADGFVDSTGQGCDNGYQNQKADLNFRWQIQG